MRDGYFLTHHRHVSRARMPDESKASPLLAASIVCAHRRARRDATDHVCRLGKHGFVFGPAEGLGGRSRFSSWINVTERGIRFRIENVTEGGIHFRIENVTERGIR